MSNPPTTNQLPGMVHQEVVTGDAPSSVATNVPLPEPKVVRK